MCGICGFITRHKITYENLKQMNDTMMHRGPDDSGEEIDRLTSGLYVGLGQRRLSIQDLSSLGHQPMKSLDGRVSVIYNGEIYNYKELKTSLNDYPFRSNCDTEIILAAYLKWGIQCVKRLNGMFAFAIYDRKNNEVYIARDRIGKKPFYYCWHDGELVFGSELKPIMAYPWFEKKIQTSIIPRYLCCQYINAPDTVFEHTYKLEPGTVLKYHNGSISAWKYWDIAKIYQKQRLHPVLDDRQAKSELKQLLLNAVKIRMSADVPVGLFLSGGYDSSLVTAIAQSISSQPVHTYAIGFEDTDLNEAVFAKEISKQLGTIHTEHYITEKEMLSLVESIPKYYDEPFADSSQIPSMLVANVAKRDVTVVLTGDGGDEFFCGYVIYDIVKKAQMLDPLGAAVDRLCRLPVWKNAGLIEKMPFKVRLIAQNRDHNTKTQLVSDAYSRLAAEMVKGEKETVAYPFEMIYQEPDWQKRRMLLDMDTYLPGDILCKVDRATMQASMEARCPLLDYRIMEYSFRLPQKFKCRNGNKKWILKEIAYDYIPEKLLNRPKKGFSVPLDTWLRGPLREMLKDYSCQEYVKCQGIFDASVVENKVSDYLKADGKGAGRGINEAHFWWSYLCFQKWYETYME